MTKCPITHFATHMFSETVTIFVEAQPQGTERAEPEVLCPSLEITGNCIQMIFFFQFLSAHLELELELFEVDDIGDDDDDDDDDDLLHH